MLKKVVPKVTAYNPAAEVGFYNRSPEDIPEIERKFKQQKRPKRSLPTPSSSPVVEEKKAKTEVNDDNKDVDVLTVNHEVKVIPVLSSEQACDRYATEAECNPRSWLPEHVHSFLLANDLEIVARDLQPLKMDGETFLKQNRETLGLRLSIKVVIVVMKFVAMLRRLDHSFQEKCKPKVEEPEPLPESDEVGVPGIKRRLDPEVYEGIVAKRMRYLADPEAFEREVSVLKRDNGKFPAMGQTPRPGKPKICYKCKGEGHLGRDCDQPNTSGSHGSKNTSEGDWGLQTSGNSQLATSMEEDWDDDKVTPAVAAAKPITTGDDDWDDDTTALPKPRAPTPTPPAKTEAVVDDDWADDPPIATSTPTTTLANRSFARDSNTSYGDDSRGRGRGGFRGGRGRGNGSVGGPRVCFRCNKEGHMSRECTEAGGNSGGRGGGKMICYKCQEEGHLGRDCPKNGGNSERRGSGKMVCYKCQGEGHLGRNCDQPNTSGSRGPKQSNDGEWGSKTSGNSKLASSMDEDWDDDKVTPALAAAKPVTAGDDDWDDPPAALSTQLAPTQTQSAKSEAVVDDDWADDPPSGTPTTANTSFGRNSNFSHNTSSYGNDSRGGGRGGFRGGRGRGSGTSGGPRVCFRCNKEGHMSRECTEAGGNSGGRGGGKMICYRCQEEGHLGRDCPKNGGNSERRGSGKMVCYKCQGEGHLGRNCDQPNTSGSRGPKQSNDGEWGSKTSGNSKLASSMDEDWDDDKVTPALAAAKPVTAGDDDWDDLPGALSTQLAPTQTQSAKSEAVVDDDWADDPPSGTPTTANTSFGRNSNFSHNTSSYGNDSRGGGRGGFRGGRGRGSGTSGGPRVCFRCNKEGHMSRECTEAGGNSGGRGGGKMICYRCQEEGHLGRDCPKNGGNSERRGSGKMVCYKCQGEGHLGRNCDQPNTSGSRGPKQSNDGEWGSKTSGNSKLASSMDEDWDDDKVTPALAAAKPVTAGDDDWDDPPGALSTQLAPTQTQSAKSEAVVDDDWADDPPSGTPTTANTSFGRNSNFSHNTSSYGNDSRGGGRGGFRGGRGRGSGTSGGPRVCFRCNKEGHMSRECTEAGGNSGGRGGGKMICYRCQEEGHLGRDCPKNGGNSERRGSGKMVCYKCQGEGHLGRNCDQPNTSGSRGPKQSNDGEWGSKTSGNSKLASSMDEDWDSKPKPYHDWDDPNTNTKPAASSQKDDWETTSTIASKAPSKPDDDWEDTSPVTKPATESALAVAETDDW